MTQEKPQTRDSFEFFLPIETRWADNDLYGHVNNVIYYLWFDTIVSRFLIEEGGFDIQADPVIGYIVESGCSYKKGIAHPAKVDGALRIGRIGTSSVTYELAIFREGEDEPAAHGFFIHVWVDRETERPAGIPDKIRVAMEKILVP